MSELQHPDAGDMQRLYSFTRSKLKSIEPIRTEFYERRTYSQPYFSHCENDDKLIRLNNIVNLVRESDREELETNRICFKRFFVKGLFKIIRFFVKGEFKTICFTMGNVKRTPNYQYEYIVKPSSITHVLLDGENCMRFDLPFELPVLKEMDYCLELEQDDTRSKLHTQLEVQVVVNCVKSEQDQRVDGEYVRDVEEIIKLSDRKGDESMNTPLYYPQSRPFKPFTYDSEFHEVRTHTQDYYHRDDNGLVQHNKFIPLVKDIDRKLMDMDAIRISFKRFYVKGVCKKVRFLSGMSVSKEYGYVMCEYRFQYPFLIRTAPRVVLDGEEYMQFDLPFEIPMVRYNDYHLEVEPDDDDTPNDNPHKQLEVRIVVNRLKPPFETTDYTSKEFRRHSYTVDQFSDGRVVNKRKPSRGALSAPDKHATPHIECLYSLPVKYINLITDEPITKTPKLNMNGREFKMKQIENDSDVHSPYRNSTIYQFKAQTVFESMLPNRGQFGVQLVDAPETYKIEVCQLNSLELSSVEAKRVYCG